MFGRLVHRSQPKEMRRFVAIGVLATVGLSAWLFVRLAPARTVVPGNLPALVGRQSTGDSVRITPSPDGRATVLLVVSEACPHCSTELARWSQLAALEPQLFQSTHIVLVRIKGGPRSAAHNVRFPHSAVVGDSALLERIGVEAIPLAVAVSPDGKVHQSLVGEQSMESVREMLRQSSLRREVPSAGKTWQRRASARD